MKASQLNLTQTRILLWGPPGSGKTALAGTMGEKLQLIDLDGNAATLATFNDKHKAARAEVDVIQGMQVDEPGKAFAFMKVKAYLLDVAKQIKEQKYPYKVLCIDSLTTFIDMATRMTLQTMRDKNQLHDLTLSRGQYQFMFNEVLAVLDILKALPIMSILIAHERTNETDNTQDHEVAIPGKAFPDQLRAKFPDILYCRVRPDGQGKSKFLLQTVRSYDATARSCLNIPDGLEMSLGLPEILKRAGVVI